MNFDYNRRNSYRRKPKKKSAYLGLWLFILSLFAALTISLVYLGKQKQRLQPPTKAKPITKVITTKEVVTPKFDFYTILSQKKAGGVVSEYELEIAIVKSYAAADRLKAELALLGFTASILPIRKQGIQKYYVSVGPYDNNDGAVADLEKLKQNNINGKLKKIR